MSKATKRLIFIIVYLAYTSIYIARVNLSMAGPGLEELSIINTLQLGLLGSVFSCVFASGRLINGSIGDKTPPWIMLTIGLSAAGIGNLIIGFLPPFAAIFALWAINAYAQSMLWSSVLCIVSSMYTKEDAKKKTSLMVTSVAMGNIAGILINTWLITKLGIRFAFIIPGFFTLILAGLVCLLTRNIKQEKTSKEHISIIKLIKEKEIRLMCLPAVMHGVMKENVSLWMTVYVVDKFSTDLSTSSYYILFIPIIGFVGRIIYPSVLKLCKDNENTVSVLGFTISTVCSVLICFSGIGLAMSVLCLSVIYAAVSMINTSILSIYPLRSADTGNVASVSGVMDFATYLGAGIASMIYGIVIAELGYSPMFISWAIVSIISIAVIMLINSNRKKLR